MTHKKRNNDFSGLGDSIARFTSLTGIDKAFKKFLGIFGIQDCGCERRRDKLNQKFPYKSGN
jgi:hypothetical protein